MKKSTSRCANATKNFLQNLKTLEINYWRQYATLEISTENYTIDWQLVGGIANIIAMIVDFIFGVEKIKVITENGRIKYLYFWEDWAADRRYTRGDYWEQEGKDTWRNGDTGVWAVQI